MAKRGFESFAPGETGALGSVEVSEADVVDFARRYDPQPFHLDAEAGRASILGGHAASGWHTSSLLMRLIATGLLAATRSMGSGHIRNLRWPRPVLVGDRLTASYRVEAVRPSSRGDRGYLEMAFHMQNQRGEEVASMEATVIMGSQGTP